MGDKFQSYYTKSNTITFYMVNELELTDNDLVLEPCGGDGVFIDEILAKSNQNVIETLDLNPDAVKKMKEKYGDIDNITVRQADALFDKELDAKAKNGGHYTKIIGNPPYGAWIEYDDRKKLKNKYPGICSKESYCLFISRCFDLLKEEGKLCLIVPDTFLYLNMHKGLREKLLKNSIMEKILIFPSKFFPGVSFGYSNMCIFTLKKTKRKQAKENTIKIIKDFKNINSFKDYVFNGNINDNASQINLNQSTILGNDNFSFLLNNKIDVLNRSCTCFLGDIADCVTGIYTGNNSCYIKSLNNEVKNSKNYQIVDEKTKYFGIATNEGLPGEKTFIPIVKGATKNKFVRDNDEWFIDWSINAIHHYKNDKKARFQNSEYYFRKGIAITMIKSSSINACLIENRVFDQSIVGIFPKKNEYLFFLLGFLNSDVANKLIHIINPTANNSSNYIKKIPLLFDELSLSKINELVSGALDNITNYSLYLDKINDIFNEIYKDYLE